MNLVYLGFYGARSNHVWLHLLVNAAALTANNVSTFRKSMKFLLFLLYACTGSDKLNADFFDVRVSCASQTTAM